MPNWEARTAPQNCHGEVPAPPPVIVHFRDKNRFKDHEKSSKRERKRRKATPHLSTSPSSPPQGRGTGRCMYQSTPQGSLESLQQLLRVLLNRHFVWWLVAAVAAELRLAASWALTLGCSWQAASPHRAHPRQQHHHYYCRCLRWFCDQGARAVFALLSALRLSLRRGNPGVSRGHSRAHAATPAPGTG